MSPAQTDVQDASLQLSAEARIEAALKTFEPNEGGQPVYIAHGRAYALDAAGKLTADDTVEQAKPYTWAMAHDVRPAGQSLGVRSCEDCHSVDAPFLFSSVKPLGPAPTDARIPMTSMTGLSKDYHRLFAGSFAFRPMLKVLGFISSGIVLAVLLLYGSRGLMALLSGQRQVREAPVDTSARRLWNALVYLALVSTFTALAVTGFLPLVRDGAVRGHWLVVHTIAGGAFTVSLALAVLSWADRCRLSIIVPAGPSKPIERTQRICFWMMSAMALGSLLSMMLGMIPLAGTETLELLRVTHLYSGVALLAVAVIHLASLKYGPSAGPRRSRRPREQRLSGD